MRSTKFRIASFFVPATALLVLAGVTAPGAVGSESIYTIAFTTQPSDALAGEVITSAPFSQTGAPVQIRVTKPGSAGPIGVPGVEVTLEFATGSATGEIDDNTVTTGAGGYATFGTLAIADVNEPQFTDYVLVPVGTVSEETITGGPSDPFDVWGDACKGSNCTVDLRGGNENYRSTENVTLTASSVSPGDLPNLSCSGQTLIFADEIFVHATDGTGAVLLTSRISRASMKAASNNGQPHVTWCLGLKTSAPWIKNGASFARQDTNGDGALDLFVGTAPKCPKKLPSTFAPCILSQTSDGDGGNITTGWVPGGDPPRRT